ncbi:D-arabinitol dehydrogenase [Klebsiella pneumoniae subsp. pneumoniae]|uniref:D-arabinitol dehydrogenase n=1 Tax=Klebsiella pneumoniae subsp. pneumoniae TaxID=72407 RepID=A0A377ZC28_KLEPN|nr:D-arabinitol dehydrogenase [Klebsiella pneumoniae subsp. pneumoniae]
MNNQFTWLHIGLGSFHRAHQAWYLHRLIASGDNRWRIAAGNIRNDAEQVVQALAAQGGRYVLETVSPEGEREYEEITSIQKLLPWQAGLQPLINEGANPQTKVIALYRDGRGVLPEHSPSAGNQQTPICRPTCKASAKPFTAPSRGSWKSAWPTTPGR